MNRRALKTLVSNGKDAFATKLVGPISASAAISTAKFKASLGSSIAVITSLIVGFLTIPNNVIYFLDHTHSAKLTAGSTGSTGDEAHSYAYIHAGIVMVVLGCLAMVVSIVLSYFAAKSKRKMDASDTHDRVLTRSTKTVYACLAMMNVELFMAVIAACMELLYQPLTSDAHRLHNVECAIAVFNIIIYVMYVVTMILTSTVLRGNRDKEHNDSGGFVPEVITNAPMARDYKSSNFYTTPHGYMM